MTNIFLDDATAATDQRDYRRYIGEIAALLDDKLVTDIYRNGPDPAIWIDHARSGKKRTEIVQSEVDAQRFMGAIVAYYNHEFSKRAPIYTSVLPDSGARLTAVHPPVVPGVSWAIRKPHITVIPLDDMLTSGMIRSTADLDRLNSLIQSKTNVLVAGPMGAGKTTLVNSMLREAAKMHPRERWALLEDTDELRCEAPDNIKLATVEGLVSYADLIRVALRLNCTRLIVGEMRDGVAVKAALNVWRTGHDGNIGTIHGKTPAEVMSRVETLLYEEGVHVDRREIAATVGAVITIARKGVGRVVDRIVRIAGVTEHGYTFQPV